MIMLYVTATYSLNALVPFIIECSRVTDEVTFVLNSAIWYMHYI